MEYRSFNDVYVVRLERGEEILSSLAALCKNEGIELATVEAIGASDHAVVGVYDLNSHQYNRKTLEGSMEITSILGNVTRKDGNPYLHLHITLCGEDAGVIGGHLLECRISLTCEIFVRRVSGNVGRKPDGEGLGLNLFDLT